MFFNKSKKLLAEKELELSELKNRFDEIQQVRFTLVRSIFYQPL